jgi:hypothetical protein
MHDIQGPIFLFLFSTCEMRIRGGAQLGEPAKKASQGEGQPTGIKFSLFLTHGSRMIGWGEKKFFIARGKSRESQSTLTSSTTSTTIQFIAFDCYASRGKSTRFSYYISISRAHY